LPSWGVVDGDFEFALPSGGRRVDLRLPYNAHLVGRVVDSGGAPVEGARAVAIPSEDPIPPHPQEQTTDATGWFDLLIYPEQSHRLLVVGPDGTATLAGMVDGDPATATEFRAEILGGIHAGDIVLDSP
jgi:hypothetical protein